MVCRANGLLRFHLVFAVLVVLGASSAFSASTGQIKGTILDKETGEAVIGASVVVVGTKQGAVTNVDGKYTILRVDPGTYTLKISSLDYNTVEVTKVDVKVDLTTEISEKMTKQVATIDKQITVVGKRDIIDKYETSGSASITQESISKRPVATVDNILKQVAGVQQGRGGEIFIRGGRGGEVGYIVDGVPIGDPLGGSSAGANLSLVAGSIQELQIIKDGFDPEYGNALSGIVNIRSQVGSKDNTNANIYYTTDDLGNGRLNKYSQNEDFLRLTLSGPDPILTHRILPALGINFLREKEFTYFLYGEVEKHDGDFQYQNYDSPATRKNFGNFNLFGLDIPERLYNRYHFQANTRFRPQQNLKFVFSYKLWDTRTTSFDWSYRFSANTAPVNTQKRQSLSLEVAHEIQKNFTYEAIVSYTNLQNTSRPGDPNNPGKGLDPDQMALQSDWETFSDLNRNGVYDVPEPIINLFPDSAIYGSDFTGPAYTIGEYLSLQNLQGGGSSFANFRFNNNGISDSLEGEPYIDVNGNGVWDRGDDLQDRNGNGIFDRDRRALVGTPLQEPYIDGDSVLGEPFIDLDGNGVYNAGTDNFVRSNDPTINHDLNHDGRYNGPTSIWSPNIPYYDRNGNGLYDAPNFQYNVGEPFTDDNGNGRFDLGGSSTFLDPLTYRPEVIWSRNRTQTYRGEVKIFRQLGAHELKGGFSLQRDVFSYERIDRPYQPYSGRLDGGAYGERGAFRDFFGYDPLQGTFYFRDKIEYGSMIANLGLRLDYFLQDTRDLAVTLRRDDRGGLILGDRQKISPRIGFSYPISDKAKVYFNYGHFFQLATFDRFFARNTSSVDQNAVLGNPNLDYQKTIQYSFGVKYAVNESYSLDVQGYFKDEFDKINQFTDESGPVKRQIYANSDYGRSRGLELTLEKRSGGYVTGQVSYTYAFAFGKASQTNPNYQANYLLTAPLDENPLDNDIRHSLKSIVQVFIPNTVKPRLFGLPIPSGWSLALESIVESGAPFTPTVDYPNLEPLGLESPPINSLRIPTTVNFDMRFSKDFKLAGIDYSFILEMANILNSRNIVDIYEKTGRADTDQNIGGLVLGGTDFNNDPARYERPRQVQVGLQISL